jgi:5-methylcytosine-specific restriction endonuclease McrA
MPHVKAAMRECGIRVMKKVGQLPHPIEKYRRGSNHPNWRGGITPYRVKIWTSPQYKSWREAVFKRDSFQCVVCRINTHDLEADHIKPFALFPELRFDVSNGRTMCKPCHRAYGANVRHGRLVNQASFRYAVESK